MRSRAQVLVLNASYEPLSVVSAPRAIALLGDGKATMVIEVPPAACPHTPFHAKNAHTESGRALL